MKKRQNYYTLFIALLLMATTSLFAQNRRPSQTPIQQLGEDIVSGTLFTLDYGLQIPAADMADRFGVNSYIGAGFLFKTTKNILIGFDGHFIFGNKIKEDSLAFNLGNSIGTITGLNGNPSEITLFERGFHITARIGKLFPLNPKNPNSGIMVLIGGGYLRHKIRINASDQIPQLQPPYRGGYDRLASGPYATQFIGYLNLDKKRRANFYGGIEFGQGFTKSQRPFHFDVQRAETDLRLDLFFGFRLGWIIPFYGKTEERYYVD